MAAAVVKGAQAALLSRTIVIASVSGTVLAFAWWFTGHKANVEPIDKYYKKLQAKK